MSPPANAHLPSASALRAPPALVRLRLAIWTLVAVFLLVLAGATALLVSNMRRSALADAQAQVMRFASVADTVLNRSFLSIDMLLASTDDLLDLSTVMVGWQRGDATSALLRSTLRQSLVVRTLALLDARGNVLASSDPGGARVRLQLPEGLLAQVLAPAMSTLVVSAPTLSFTSSERVLYFARYFRLANGSHIVALAEVPTSALVPVMTQGVDIAGLEVTLERSSGTLLLSVPELVSTPAGRRPPSLEELALTALTASVQAWDQPTRLSQRPGLVVARHILYQDLWLTASMSLSDALVPWRAERRSVLVFALALALMILAAGALTQAYFQRARAARRTLAEAKATLDQALESMVSGFVLLDDQRQVLQWNRRFEELFPWLTGTIAPQMPFERLLEASAQHQLPQGGAAERAHWVRQRMQLQQTLQGPHEQKLPSGKVVQIIERATPRGGLVISYQDVTDLRRASAEIETLAFYDPLTGLPNRRLLLDRLRQATGRASRMGQLGAVLFLDLNQFKMLNDTQGHEVGDLLLQQVAGRLRAGVRDSDTVARLGGDEFVVLLDDLPSDNHEAAALAQRLGEKLLYSLGQPYVLGSFHYQGACSMGATLFGMGAEHSAAELLKQADIAMYAVKTQPRGSGLCFFDPQMQTLISTRAQLQSDLQQALARGELLLHYQPQFSLDERMVGAEALLRWQHPERGMVSPAEFIAMAEECGLIVPIGQWVLRSACEQLARWQGDVRRAHLCLSVNVSARQFRQADFVDQVVQEMARSKVRPQQLKLELTESLVLDNLNDTIAKMLQLRERGVQFSLDDFGTGYSSLSYLTRLPLHELKIDQSFVRNLGLRPTDDVIVQTIIGMASTLGLDVIAEGVETEQQKNFLARHGCHLYQGYLLGRPMPVAELEAMVLRAARVSPLR